jgi:hypothetical protein
MPETPFALQARPRAATSAMNKLPDLWGSIMLHPPLPATIDGCQRLGMISAVLLRLLY